MKPGNRSYIRYLKSISNASYSNTKVMDIWEVNKKSPRQMGMATYSNICLHKLSHAYMVYLYLSKYLFKYDFARKILMTQKIFAI